MRDVPEEGAVRFNISLPARVLRLADALAKANAESRSALLARLIRAEGTAKKLDVTDKRFDPPKEKTK